MKMIRVYQNGYPPDVFREVAEDYKVVVLERGALRVEASGSLVIYNPNAWHSVEIIQDDQT